VDLVQPGVTGLLVRPGDGAALTDAVARLAAEPHTRRRYATAARAAVAGRGWDVVGDELLGHYEAVLAGPGVPAPIGAAA
jgi:phosphatidylinositol alpha 1,6-mannosyltransferase